jgi:hypothetical protein
MLGSLTIRIDAMNLLIIFNILGTVHYNVYGVVYGPLHGSIHIIIN